MRFDMFSPSKKQDKEFLLELSDLIELLVKVSALDLAEKFGDHYVALDGRIKNHDYSPDDEFYERIFTAPRVEILHHL